MAQTPAGPQPRTDTTHRQQALYVRQAALQIKALADQILLDHARGRVVRANGRQIIAIAVALCEASALLAEQTAARGEVAA